MNAENVLMELAACAVNERTPDQALLDELQSREDLMRELFKVSGQHQLTALAAYALLSGGIHQESFERARYQAVFFECAMDQERASVLGKMEEAGIWYLPMKGVVLKELYPKVGMRQMGDNDILFDADRAEDLRSVMESLGFRTEAYGTMHHDVYQKPPFYTFEMHTRFFANIEEYRVYIQYYANVKDSLIKDEDNAYGYHFSDEDFYVFMLVHEYRHHSWRGTGLRSLLDVYVYLKRYNDSLNWDYLRQELDRLGLTEFEELNRSLAFKVFADPENRSEIVLTSGEEALLNDFLISGTYGNYAHTIKVQMQGKSRFRYTLSRIFLPMEKVEQCYPRFYKHKILLPVLPFYRLVKRKDSAKREIRVVMRKGKS